MRTTFCLGRPGAAFLVAVALIVGPAVFAQFPPPPQPPPYTIKNLGTLCVPTPELGCESDYSFARDVNNFGQVVGGSSIVQEREGVFFELVTGAFRTSAGQPINPSTDLLHSTFSEGTAFAINDSGKVVGTIATPTSDSLAFMFAGSGPLTLLPSALNCQFIFTLACNAAYGINNSGIAVGTNLVDISPSMRWHAARWTPALQDLDTLGFRSEAYDINDSGLAVGFANVGLNRHAAVFGGLSPISLGTLGGSECDTCDSVAYGVNNAGPPDPTSPTTARIVGQSALTPTGPHHAFVFQFGPGLGMQDLGTLCAQGDCDSAAFDINDLGHIVGATLIGPFPAGAFLYKNNQMTDLNSLLGASDQTQWVLGEARAINELGQIAGTGQFQGKARAFLMTPPLSFIFANLSQLVTVALRPGTSQSLLAILQAAQAAIERNQHGVAGLQLNAYEHEVRALVEGRQLTEIQGAKLLAGATLIRRVMEEERTR